MCSFSVAVCLKVFERRSPLLYITTATHLGFLLTPMTIILKRDFRTTGFTFSPYGMVISKLIKRDWMKMGFNYQREKYGQWNIVSDEHMRFLVDRLSQQQLQLLVHIRSETRTIHDRTQSHYTAQCQAATVVTDDWSFPAEPGVSASDHWADWKSPCCSCCMRRHS